MTKQLDELVSVSEIAHAIAKDWINVNPYAVDYLNAMKQIRSVKDSYYAESAHSVILYFLANAGTYRGENARTYKALLKDLLKENN